MQHFFVKFVIPVTFLTVIMSCKPNIKTPAPSKGSVNATRFVAIGNSITAGYADEALYYDGQQNSFVNLIAQQFKLIGGGEFKQPMMNPGSVGVGTKGNAPFKLDYATDCLGVSSLMPVPVADTGDVAAWSTSVYSSQGPFNNMGVPGAKVITALQAGYAGSNPFFYRMAANTSTSSMLSDAVAMDPTFFSIFLGNNDVLTYALTGATADAITPSAGAIGVGFDASFNALVNAMTANGAKGVVANIPDITSLPYFTTIPYNGLAINQAQADQLNGALNGLFTFEDGSNQFKSGNNQFIIEDTSVAFVYSRPIVKGELIRLEVPLDKIKCGGMGALTPIPDEYVLTLSEIAKIQNAINSYNVTIKAVADAKGLAFVDVNSFLRSAQKGIIYNGVTLSSAFVTGGTFSLDGLHLNPIGQALLANEFIKAINSKYGSTIPQVDATKYRGIIFP